MRSPCTKEELSSWTFSCSEEELSSWSMSSSEKKHPTSRYEGMCQKIFEIWPTADDPLRVAERGTFGRVVATLQTTSTPKK